MAIRYSSPPVRRLLMPIRETFWTGLKIFPGRRALDRLIFDRLRPCSRPAWSLAGSSASTVTFESDE
jgi:hypothetical protein